MRDILGGGPPLGPTPPPPPPPATSMPGQASGPLGRAAQASGITQAAPKVDDRMAEQAKAELAAEQVRMADLAGAQPPYRSTSLPRRKPGGQASQPSAPSTPFNPPELRHHKLNAPRTEANARKFAEGLAGRFPQFAFETVPHRLAKNKFAVKVSPVERQSPPDAQAQAAHQAAPATSISLPRRKPGGQASPEPTQAQKDAGNYRKGHVRYAGLNISIENPKGSKRSGVGPEGTPWEVEMQGVHYGYIRRSEGNDGEQVDVYLASDREDTPAFVVDQIDPQTGKFDEHKSILGAASREEAEAIYDAHFSA
ncbi:MAG: hypothetical protein ACREVJ_15360, partial [Gammaproteobacteria bacterium]